MPFLLVCVLPASVTACDAAVNGSKTTPCDPPQSCPCAGPGDCPADYSCTTWDGEPLCLKPCAAGCPDGWRCQGIQGAGGTTSFVCLPARRAACEACNTDSECGGEADLCVATSDGTHCADACDDDELCPTGYTCADATGVSGASGRMCLPTSGACACSIESEGYLRSCVRESRWGACHGVEACEQGQWTECTAPAPAEEVCNGRDDDCDGLIDTLDPTLAPPPDAPNFPACGNGPTCTGELLCLPLESGVSDWVCTAPPAREELCNKRDDDCDGVADNGFIDAQGRYIDPHHCGDCNQDCEAAANLRRDGGAVAEGAVTCELEAETPACLVHACEPGFVPYPAGSPRVCLPVSAVACLPCGDDADCTTPGDRCVELGPDRVKSCALNCSADAPQRAAEPCDGETGVQGCCPADFTCTELDSAALCLPDGGSCACSNERDGIERPCVASGAGGATCFGVQQCTAGEPATWSTCDAAPFAEEICNGLDDDCDGEIDEELIDQQGTGTYDTDEHCGACSENCTYRWNPQAHHVVGHCGVTGATPECTFDPADCVTAAGPGGTPCDAGCSGDEVCLTLAVPGIQYAYFQCGEPCLAESDCGGNRDCVGGVCLRKCNPGAAGDLICAGAHGSLSYCGSEGRCVVDYQWRDRNGRAVDGCECPAALGAGDDEPRTFATYPAAGALYLDSDCDDVDGHAEAAVFVSASNQGQADGSRAHPFRTLNEGLASLRASLASKRYVLAATGVYRESIVLTPGVRIYGGYSGDFRRRDIVTYSTALVGVEPDYDDPSHARGSVSAECVPPAWDHSAFTELSGFTIYGYDVSLVPGAGEAGQSSYAVYVKQCGADLHLTNNVIVAGRGGLAGSGLDGAVGRSGGDGDNGLDAEPCGCCSTSGCASCAGVTNPGGVGGENPDCSDADGDEGAASVPATDAVRGTYQCSASYCSLNCRYDCTTGAGGNGTDGDNGDDGTTPAGAGGDGCSAAQGSVVDDEWTGGSSGEGAAGLHGAGGAGGVAGGWANYGSHNNPAGCQPADLYKQGDFGGTGGGGGAGGCGGGGGRGGAGGGGSFAVFVWLAAAGDYPEVRGNVIVRGTGGGGGGGGFGNLGGMGGLGGIGGGTPWPSWCAALGGVGGRGGSGGSGGGGGGGCGGVAFGIGGRNIGASGYAGANSFAPASGGGGAAGAGGGSPAGAMGGAGVDGAAGDFISFP